MLDSNRIAIRERTLLEIFDLALAVIRDYGAPLLVAFAVGIVPMILLDTWLIGELAYIDYSDGEPPLEFLGYLTLLVVFQLPWATAPATRAETWITFACNSTPGMWTRSGLTSKNME